MKNLYAREKRSHTLASAYPVKKQSPTGASLQAPPLQLKASSGNERTGSVSNGQDTSLDHTNLNDTRGCDFSSYTIMRYHDAIARHTENWKKVKRIMDDPSKVNTIVRKNAVEMIKQKRVHMYIATQTHDAEERARYLPKYKSGQFAHFGMRDQDVYPNETGYYSRAITYNDGLINDSDGRGAAYWDKKMLIKDPIKHDYPDEEIIRAIVHEVQHYSDHHGDEKGRNRENVNKAWSDYKVEYRAFWLADTEMHQQLRIEGGKIIWPKSSESGTARNAHLGFDTSVQEAIFMNLVGNYDWVDKNWMKNRTVTRSENPDEVGKTFRELVAGYSKPEGINLLNSIRIDDFYLALKKCNRRMRHSDEEIQDLLEKASQLSPDEKADIFSSDKQDSRLYKTMQKRLNRQVWEELIRVSPSG